VCGSGVLGAVKALAPGGNDALPAGLTALRDGEMAATVEQLPGEQVESSMTALVDFIRDKKPLASKKLTPVLITKDNLNQAERYTEVK
jgi:inositol transport system substrate-binding protein